MFEGGWEQEWSLSHLHLYRLTVYELTGADHGVEHNGHLGEAGGETGGV